MAKLPDGLRPQVADFLLEYEANGRNATAAYMRTHPNCTSRGSAAVLAHRLLRTPKVERALKQLRESRVKRLNMDADEATMLTSMRARANLAHAYDEHGNELPMHQWPLELQVAVKGRKKDGSLTLIDQQTCTRTILEMNGKLKQTVDVNHFDHIGYLAARQREHEERHGQGDTAGRNDSQRESEPTKGRRARPARA